METQAQMIINTPWFYLPLVLGIAQLAANWSVHPCFKKVKTFTETLSDEQKKIYEAVTEERKTIANNALMQGIFLALLYSLYVITMTCPLRRKGWYYYFSDVLCIILNTMYLSYMIAPKKRNMVIEADLNAHEAVEYAKIYKCFDVHFWSAFTLAVIISIFFLTLLDILAPSYKVALIFNLSVPLPSTPQPQQSQQSQQSQQQQDKQKSRQPRKPRRRQPRTTPTTTTTKKK